MKKILLLIAVILLSGCALTKDQSGSFSSSESKKYVLDWYTCDCVFEGETYYDLTGEEGRKDCKSLYGIGPEQCDELNNI